MIEEVKRIFDDIRDAIIEMGGNIDVCTSPEDYDEAIKTLAGNNAVLFVPVFKSSEIKPDTPTSPMSSSTPTAYPDGGSTPDGLTGNVGMSYTIVGPTVTYVPWTEPLLIKTINDVAPDTYDDATTRTFLIFLELQDGNLVPQSPIGGTGNVTENRLVGTITSELYKDDAYIGRTIDTWSTDNNHVRGCYTWMSMGTFIAETGQIMKSNSDPSGGSTPICINSARDGKDGADGINGVDGDSIEFIYKLCADEDAAQLVPTPESNPNVDDYVPDPNPNTKGYWCDHPMGIDPVEYRAEVMCTRKKESNGQGGDFMGPIVWAIGGEDGTDGDGIEYIFRVASQQEVIDNGDGSYTLKPEFGPPTCEEGCASAFLTKARTVSSYESDAQALEVYQQNEFVPGHLVDHPDAAGLGGDLNGTDDPLDVSPSQPFEFCSIRKYDGDFANVDGTKGTWRWFSEPVLGNKFWSGYAPVFTSFVFTRSRLKLGGMELTGGDIYTPYPDPQNVTQTVDGVQVTERITWFDTIPGPDDFPNDETIGHAPVGMTTRQFGSIDPDHEEQDQGWESPRLMADSRFYNIEYSASDTVTLSTRLPRFDERINNSYPFIDDNDPEGVNESAGRTYCQTNGLGVWGDENDIPHPKGMATCSFIDGKGTEGSLSQVKGERGADGAGEETVYIRTNTYEAPTVSSSSADSHGKTYVDDDYLPKASGGDLSAATECTDDAQGADYYHKFEWEAKRKKVTDPNDPEGKVKIWEPYTGAMHLHSNGAENGADGISREGVYKRQTANPGTPPSSGNGEISPNGEANGNVAYSDQLADWVPNGWGDSPQGIASTDKTEWASYRDYDNITRKGGPFSAAKIGSQWGEKGEDGDGVQYVYKLFDHELTDAERTSNIPTKPASQDAQGEGIPQGGSDDPQAPTSSMQYCYCSVIKRINGTGGLFEKLGLWSKGANDGETGPQGPQGNPGSRGPIGPKMRMRNGSTTYGTPPVSNVYTDEDGVHGGQCGDNSDDDFYDIAIYPVAADGITVSNAAANADRLGRCTQNLPYSTLAGLITTYGADNVYPGTGGHLEQYFTQAVGWDFVATKLLLADKINANQIDVNGLSAKTIVTDVTDGSYASIAGNTIELKKNGTTKCKISGNPITVNASQGVETVGSTPLGYRFAGGAFQNGFNKTIDLGSFEIKENAQHQIDTIKSASPQQINFDFIGTGKQNVGPNTVGDVGVYGTVQLKARNQETQQDVIGYTAGYGANVLLFDSNYNQTTTPGQEGRSGDNGAHTNGHINLDTSDPANLNPGKYSLILDIAIVDGCAGGQGLGAYFENMELYLSQYSNDGGNTGIGEHYPIIKTEAVSSEIQYTDIGTDGFAHVLDGNNYFKVQKESGNNYLTLEFLSGGQYGLKIDGTGIYKTTSGSSGGTQL